MLQKEPASQPAAWLQWLSCGVGLGVGDDVGLVVGADVGDGVGEAVGAAVRCDVGEGDGGGVGAVVMAWQSRGDVRVGNIVGGSLT